MAKVEYVKPYLKSKKILIIIRDLRDIAVSFFYFKTPLCYCNDEGLRDRFLFDLIKAKTERTTIKELLLVNRDILSSNIRMLKFFQKFNTCIIKFENIVGEKGGGTHQAQIKEIDKICAFLEIPINNSQIEYIIENLFGLRSNDYGTKSVGKALDNTFHDGQIGKWKTHFNEENSQLFYSKYGDYLRTYEYELN